MLGNTTMRITSSLGLLVLALSFSSCAKETLDVAQDIGLLPSGCGADGARFQASIAGSAYCASAQIIATGDGSSVIVTGIDLAGNTLVLQLDTLAVGEHPMNEASNGALYMQAGTTYTIAPNVAGVLTISAHDPDARKLKASFDVPVLNEMNGVTKQVQGEVDVTYSTGG